MKNEETAGMDEMGEVHLKQEYQKLKVQSRKCVDKASEESQLYLQLYTYMILASTLEQKCIYCNRA